MKYNHNKKLVSNAKALRKNMTKEDDTYGMTICEAKMFDLFVKK